MSGASKTWTGYNILAKIVSICKEKFADFDVDRLKSKKKDFSFKANKVFGFYRTSHILKNKTKKCPK